MARIQSLKELADASRPQQGANRPRTVDLSTDALRIGKLTLYQALRQVEPDYQVPDNRRQLLADLTLWALRATDGPYDPAKGFWLWGNIGAGKSTIMQGLKYACRSLRPSDDPPCHPAWRIESAGDICRAYQSYGADGIEQYITSLSLCIDDIGTEPQLTNHFGTTTNVIGDLLLARYDLRRTALTHVTANINPDDIARFYGPRVFDRAREMFNFVQFSGSSWRKEKSNLQGML